MAYSLPLACGDMAAAFEMLFGCELGVRHRQFYTGFFEVTC